MSPSTEPFESESKEPTTQTVIGRIAHAMEHTLSTGELAQLRRASVESPYSPALWKLLVAYVPDTWTAGRDRDEKERLWSAVLTGMAITSGLHSPGTPLGQALEQAGWSELRFVRLLQARGDALVGEVRRVARFLSSKTQIADWADMAQLVLNQREEWAEKHRRRIARSYYSSLHHHERADSRQSEISKEEP